MSRPTQPTALGRVLPQSSTTHPPQIPTTLDRLKDGSIDDVARPVLAVLAPDLAKIPGTAIRHELLTRSAQFLAGLTSIQCPHTLTANALPPSMYVLLPREQPGGNTEYPTHMLALSPPTDRYTPRDIPVCVVPIHGAVFAAHSARVVLPPPVPHLRPRYLTLPMCRMTVPSVTAFVSLRSYMYSRRIDVFLEGLLPLPRAFLAELQPGREASRIRAASTSPQEIAYLTQQMLYSSPGRAELFWVRLNQVKEMWETVCALVMCDELLWQGLDFAWHLARTALLAMLEHERRDSEAAKMSSNQQRSA